MKMKSTYEWRKNAPFHFLAKADNARFCAYHLYNFDAASIKIASANAPYGGEPSIGLHEGYLREAALALELVIKATIAIQNIEAPATHKLVNLWSIAGLPKLSKIQRIRLRNYQMLLEWAGRYIVPTTENRYLQDLKETRLVKAGTIAWIEPIDLSWESFDDLYQIALTGFSKHNTSST